MAIFETPWYQIDTEDFETETDVKKMIHHVHNEALALCRHCRKQDICRDNLDTPEYHPGCIRDEDYRALVAVMDALIPYGVALAVKNVA